MRPYFRVVSMLSFLLVASTAGAATYYVDNLDSGCSPGATGAGTLSDPWKSLPYAVTHLQCGDTLQVRRGTYRINAQGYNSSGACLVTNGVYALMPFTQKCTASNPITVSAYNGETVILDGTSTQIDSTGSWTQCESSSQCGPCTGLSLSDHTRTYYSKAWNFSSANTPQMWIDPPCTDADGTCTSPAGTGTRLKWIGANYPGCANLNNLNGACDNSWSSPTCGTFDTGAIANAIVARLADTASNADPDGHIVKISCQGGGCSAHPIHFQGASYINVNGGGNMYIKYGYYGIVADGAANHITVDNVRISGIGGRDYGQCIRTGNANQVTLQNSTCNETAAEGIGFYGGGHGSCVQISGNAAINNTISNTGFASSNNSTGSVLDDGIIIKSCSNCVARGNTIRDSGRNGIEVTSNWNSTGVCNADAPLIEKNKISRSCNSVSPSMGTDCAAVHLVPPGSNAGTINNGIVRNNFIYDEAAGRKSQITPFGIKVDSGVGATEIVNNSIQNVGYMCIDTNEDHPPAGTFTVKNNALYKCNVGNLGGAGYVKMNAATDWTHSQNTYWGDSNSVAIRINSGVAVNRDDVVNSFESSAVQANPSFLSLTDLHLAVGSPLVDKGANLGGMGFSDDIDGRARPQGAAWDIGANERGSDLPAPALLSVEPVP